MSKEKTSPIRGDHDSGFWYIVFDFVFLLIEIITYIFSFLGPAYVLWVFKEAHWALIVTIAVLGWYFACAAFAFTLVVIKRVFLGKISFGRYLLTSLQNKNALKWGLADRIVRIMHRSLFAPWVASHVLFRTIFYKGMGAKINSTLVMGKGCMISDPWGFTAGNNVIIGLETSVTGHKVENLVVTLGPVTVGNNVTLGARSIIMPNVEIGNNVIIGANSVVTSGTTIPDGETWVGNPAKKAILE